MKKDILDIIKTIIPYMMSFLWGKSSTNNKAKDKANDLVSKAKKK